MGRGEAQHLLSVAPLCQELDVVRSCDRAHHGHGSRLTADKSNALEAGHVCEDRRVRGVDDLARLPLNQLGKQPIEVALRLGM